MRKDKVIREVLGDDIAISPSELYNRSFRRALVGGYSRSAVDEYLAGLADTMESLLVQVRMLRDKNEEQKSRLEEYRQMESTLRSALISSRKFGEDIIENAKRQADAVIEEARAKRAQVVREAAKIPAVLNRDIQVLDQQRHRMRVEMLSILETHRRLLDSLIPEASIAESLDVISDDEAGNAPGHQAAADARQPSASEKDIHGGSGQAGTEQTAGDQEEKDPLDAVERMVLHATKRSQAKVAEGSDAPVAVEAPAAHDEPESREDVAAAGGEDAHDEIADHSEAAEDGAGTIDSDAAEADARNAQAEAVREKE